ncbi:MAG: PAS domain S-box protein [Methanoregula sp.]|nr:MAG: PAS domain S-box protein [Methanoregula sp.]
MDDIRRMPAENTKNRQVPVHPAAEKAASEREEKFREIFDKINDAIHIHEILDDGSPGRFIEVNEVACRMLQYSKEEFLSRTPLDFTTDYHSRPLKQIIAELATHGSALFETEHKRKDGVIIPVEVNAHVIQFGGKRRVLSVVRDITGRKRSKEALREIEEKYQDFIDNATDLIQSVTPEGKIEYVNKAWKKTLGYSEKDIPHLSLMDFVHPDSLSHCMEAFKRVLSGENIRDIDAVFISKDGKKVSVEGNANCRFVNGKPTYTRGIFRDVTERKQMEKVVLASLKEKEILLKEIHHRVKNNLQIIASLLSLQSRYITDENVLNALKESQNRIKAMALVHERLYRSENLSSVALADYLRYLIDNLFGFYGVNPQMVRLAFDAGDVKVDINQAIPIGLIMNELVSNSLKHAFPEGEKGELTVTIRRDESALVLTVHDTGPGIPADFDWRNAKSLGLRLVISLVEQLQGTIELDRSGGTTFKIIIPKRPGQGGNHDAAS